VTFIVTEDSIHQCLGPEDYINASSVILIIVDSDCSQASNFSS